MKYVATIGEKTYTIEINQQGKVLVDGEERLIDFKALDGETSYSLLIDNVSHEGLVQDANSEVQVLLRGAGTYYEVGVMDEREQRLATATSGFASATGEIAIRSPMPGMVVAVTVAVGDEVKNGQAVVILESMKMENELKAPRDGKVSQVIAEAGQNVEQNAVLVVIT